MDVQDESRLVGLCASIAERARGLGHELEPWEAPPGEESVARRTACRRCGRTVYARVEGDLMGVSGGAARERCSQHPIYNAWILTYKERERAFRLGWAEAWEKGEST